MFRLFSYKQRVRGFTCLAAFLIINSVLFRIQTIASQQGKGTPRTSATFNTSLLFDRTKEQSIYQYFQHKEQTMRRSPFKTILPNTIRKPADKTSYLIYEYTRHRQFCRRSDSTSAYLATCPFRNCYFTCNSSLINRTDAILALFSSRANYNQLRDLNTRRNPDQVWVLWHDEPSPTPTTFNSLRFNWTISYRFDSEVSVGAYGVAFRKDQPMSMEAFRHWLTENYQKRGAEAVWFVSNCHSKARLRYYQQLRDHFPISVFGKCVADGRNATHMCKRGSRCELEKLSTSKFYLAFESNAARLDYITEKFWRSFTHGVIPVVLGPKRRDYERVAPPNSFIYAGDYPSPEKLAKHLNEVASSPEEYAKYHMWRVNYETRHTGREVESFRFCELCYKLNTNRNRIWYTDLRNYLLETE